MAFGTACTLTLRDQTLRDLLVRDLLFGSREAVCGAAHGFAPERSL